MVSIKQRIKKQKYRNSIIVCSIISLTLFSGITPLVDWGDIKEKPKPIWFDPSLADFLYDDSINQTTYPFNAYNEGYIICKIQNKTYTTFTFNSTVYNASYGINYFAVDFGKVNQSYSIEISQADVNNNVFDWISVQPLYIKEDIITVNLDTSTDITFEGGGAISLLFQPNFTYNEVWIEFDGTIIKNNYTDSIYVELDVAKFIALTSVGNYIQYDLSIIPGTHTLKFKGNGSIDYKIISSYDWDEDLISDSEEIQRMDYLKGYNPTEPIIWGFFERGEGTSYTYFYENETFHFTLFIPDTYSGSGYLNILLAGGTISNVIIDNDDVLFKDTVLSRRFAFEKPLSIPCKMLSKGFHSIKFNTIPSNTLSIHFAIDGRPVFIKDEKSIQDRDADYLKDNMEKDNFLNPRNPDTDFDGVIDGLDESPTSSLVLDKSKIQNFVLTHNNSKNTMLKLVVKRPDNDYYTVNSREWTDSSGKKLEVNIIPMLRILGNSTVLDNETKTTWDKDITKYPTTENDSSYGDCGIYNADEDIEFIISYIYPKVSEETFTYDINYEIGHPAKNDSIIDINFDIVWVVTTPYNSSIPKIIHYYEFDDDIILVSFMKREIANVSYIFASPDSNIEHEILFRLIQNSNLGSFSDFGISEENDIVGHGNIDYFDLFDQLDSDREGNPISKDAYGNIDENEVLYLSHLLSTTDILSKVILYNETDTSLQLEQFGDHESLICFYSSDAVIEEDLVSFIEGDNVGEFVECYAKTSDIYEFSVLDNIDVNETFEERLTVSEYPVYMNRITNLDGAEILEYTYVSGSGIPINELPNSLSGNVYDKLYFVNITIIEKEDSSSGIPSIAYDYYNDIYKSHYDFRVLDVDQGKLIFCNYSVNLAWLFEYYFPAEFGYTAWMSGYFIPLNYYAESLSDEALAFWMQVAHEPIGRVLKPTIHPGIFEWVDDLLGINQIVEDFFEEGLAGKLVIVDVLETFVWDVITPMNDDALQSLEAMALYGEWNPMVYTDLNTQIRYTIRRAFTGDFAQLNFNDIPIGQIMINADDLKRTVTARLEDWRFLKSLADTVYSQLREAQEECIDQIQYDVFKAMKWNLDDANGVPRRLLPATLDEVNEHVKHLRRYRRTVDKNVRVLATRKSCQDYGFKQNAEYIKEMKKLGIQSVKQGAVAVAFGVIFLITSYLEVIFTQKEMGKKDFDYLGFRLLSGYIKIVLSSLVALSGLLKIASGLIQFFSHIERIPAILSSVAKVLGIASMIAMYGVMVYDFIITIMKIDQEGHWLIDHPGLAIFYETIKLCAISSIPFIIMAIGSYLGLPTGGWGLVIGLAVALIWGLIEIICFWLKPRPTPVASIEISDDQNETYIEFPEADIKRQGGLEVGDEIKFHLNITNDGTEDAWMRANFSAGESDWSADQGEWEAPDKYTAGESAEYTFSRTLPNTKSYLEMKIGIEIDIDLGSRENVYNEIETWNIDMPILDSNITAFYDDTTELNKSNIYDDLIVEYESLKASYQHKDKSETLSKLSNRVLYDFLNDTTGNLPSGWNEQETDFDTFTGIIRPNEDITTEWQSPASGDHFAEINEELEDPEYATDGDKIICYYPADWNREVFAFDEFDVDKCTKVELKVYGAKAGNPGPPDTKFWISFDNGSNWEDMQDIEFEDAYDWYTLTWDENDFGEITDIDDFRVKIEADTTDGTDQSKIDVLYAIITYENSSSTSQGLISTKDGHNKVMEIETRGEYAIYNFYKTLSSAHTSGNLEFWINKASNYTQIEVDKFFRINELGDIITLDGDTLIKPIGISLDIWDNIKVSYNSTHFDVYINGIKIGDDISHSKSNFSEIEFITSHDIDKDDENKFSKFYTYLDAIDFSWENGYYDGRSYAWDYTLDEIQEYGWEYGNLSIFTNIDTDLSENIVEMDITTDIAEFDFYLDLEGTHYPTVNYTFSIPDGFTIAPNTISQALNDRIKFNITANDPYQFAGIYYIDMNITFADNNTLIYSEKIPFRIPVDEDFSFVQSNVIFDEYDFNGNYTSTYDFLGDTGTPDGWTPVNGASISEGDNDGHIDSVQLHDGSGLRAGMYKQVDQYEDGTVEFWVRKSSNDVNGNHDTGLNVRLYTASANGVEISIDRDNNGKILCREGANYVEYYSGFKQDTWYHMKVDFGLDPEDYDLYLNGILLGADIDWYYHAGDYIKYVKFETDESSRHGTWYVDAIGWSWDSDYRIGDNLYKTDSNSDTYQSSTELEKGDVIFFEYKTNTYSEIEMDFLNNNIIQATHTMIPRGNLYLGVQYSQIIVDEDFSFDRIEFSDYKSNYLEIFHISVIDASAEVSQQFNPLNFTNNGNIPKFVSFDFSGVYFDNVSQTLYPDEFFGGSQIAIILPNSNRISNFDITLPDESISNLLWRGITCAESGTNNIYNLYTDNLEIDGIHIVSPKNRTHNIIGETISSGKYEMNLEIIPKESLVWKAYSLDGNANVSFSGNNVNVSLPEIYGNHTIQVFGNNSLGTMFESEVRYFIIEYPIKILTIRNGTTYYDTNNEMLVNATFGECSDFEYSLDGRSRKGLNTTTNLIEHIPYGLRNIIVYGNDTYGEEYSSGLIEFEVALDRQTVPQPDGFTFTNGTLLQPYGDLRFIDGNYSIIKSTPYQTGNDIVVPNDDITNNVWTAYPSTSDHYTRVDEYPSKTTSDWCRGGGTPTPPQIESYKMNTFTLPSLATVNKIEVYLYGQDTGSNDPSIFISWNDGSDWGSEQSTADWNSGYDYRYDFAGLNKDQDDLNGLSVKIKYYPGLVGSPPSWSYFYLYTIWVKVYYETDDAEVDVQIDMNVTDSNVHEVEYLFYSHKTNVSTTVDLDIWNWTGSTWHEIESVSNTATFDKHLVALTNESAYLNLSTNGVRIRYQSSINADFQIELEALTLLYSTTLIPSNLYETPIQPDNFTLEHGTFDTYGELETIDGNYSVISSIGAIDHYPGTYSFEDDDLSDTSTDISFVDVDISTHAQCYLEVHENHGGHDMVMALDDNSNYGYSGAKNIYDTEQTSGTVEAWVCNTNTGFAFYTTMRNQDAERAIILYQYQDDWKYYDGTGGHSLSRACSDNTWYHIRIDFECGSGGYMGLSADRWRVFIDGDEYGAFTFYSESGACDEMESLEFNSMTAFSGSEQYIDGVGYSWDSGYDIGDNLDSGINIDFQVDIEIDDEYCYFPNSLSYSYKTNISQTIDLDVWNWDTETWVEIESVNNSATFDDDIFWLEYGCMYINPTNGIRIRFQALECENNFKLEIDQLRLDYYNIG